MGILFVIITAHPTPHHVSMPILSGYVGGKAAVNCQPSTVRARASFVQPSGNNVGPAAHPSTTLCCSQSILPQALVGRRLLCGVVAGGALAGFLWARIASAASPDLATAARREPDPEIALELWTQAVGATIADPAALIGRANTLLRLGRWAEAEADFTAALPRWWPRT